MESSKDLYKYYNSLNLPTKFTLLVEFIKMKKILGFNESVLKECTYSNFYDLNIEVMNSNYYINKNY